jgi:hypothetical protein
MRGDLTGKPALVANTTPTTLRSFVDWNFVVFQLDRWHRGGQAFPAQSTGAALAITHLQKRGRAMIRRQAETYHRAIRTCEPVVKCPKCAASTKYFRTPFAHIDTCGFESYSFRCECCGSAIGGVVNPLDDKLMVSLLEPAIDMRAISSGVSIR